MDAGEGKRREKSKREKPQSKIWMQEEERKEKSPKERSRRARFGCRRRKEEKKVQERENVELMLDAGEGKRREKSKKEKPWNSFRMHEKEKKKVRKARRNKARIGLYIIKKNNYVHKTEIKVKVLNNLDFVQEM